VKAGATPTLPGSDAAAPRGARLWIFRLVAALGVPALLVFGLEGALRLTGYGQPAGFLIPDEQPGYYRTNPNFVRLFMPSTFDLRPQNFRITKTKPADTWRVVVLGESAVQGVPTPAFGLVAQLRAQLRARYPERKIEVLNAGVVAINSHVVRRIMEDLADFSPDLVVVYLGNNEVVGPYGPGCAYLSAMPPIWVIRLSTAVRASRTGQLLGSLLGRLRPPSAAPTWEGMSMFVDQAVAGDDPRLERSYENLGANLHAILRTAERARARSVVCTVVANLKDCPPLLSRHRPGLAGSELAEWQQRFDRGLRAWKLGDNAAARVDLTAAAALDPQYADTRFMLGSLDWQAGNAAAAREQFVAALHWDALRFRPDPRINEVIRETTAAHPQARLVDTARLLSADPAATGTPAGRELLFEHVHLDWAGNYQVALAVAEAAESLLPARAQPATAWLDSEACAVAVGCSPVTRFSALQRIAPIVQSPPFTQQLTYPEDMARLGSELAAAARVRADPAAVGRARAALQAVRARDPENPDLARLEEDLADEAGDLPAALAAAQEVRRLQPRNHILSADEAIKLARLERYAEAENLLKDTFAAATPAEQVVLAPAFGDLYTRLGQPNHHREFLDRLIARMPTNTSLRLQRWRLDATENPAGVERAYRALHEREPANAAALEALVGWLTQAGRSREAGDLSLEAATRQPRNQANNLRAALVAAERGDVALEIRLLQAAVRSGPVNSGVALRLARLLYASGNRSEAMLRLAEAWRISTHEGDPETTREIARLIASLRAKEAGS
jgi:thioredoxin-like negative regulator of GroEL